MGSFRCDRFPTGVAHVRTALGIVDFRDGYAEVDDPEVAGALRELPAVFGIVDLDGPEDNDGEADSDETEEDSDEGASDEVAEEGQPAADGRPTVRASKDDWVAYAVTQGLDRVEVNAMSKKDIIELLKG